MLVAVGVEVLVTVRVGVPVAVLVAPPQIEAGEVKEILSNHKVTAEPFGETGAKTICVHSCSF